MIGQESIREFPPGHRHLLGPPEAARWAHQPLGAACWEVARAILTVGELLTWARRRDAPPRRLAGIEEFLSEVETLPVDEKVAEVFAELRAGQFDTGRLTPSTDLWIAATAIAHDLTLVTHNTRDFEHVSGLSLVDWLEA